MWNPYLKKVTEQLEKVQQFALRMCMKQSDASYSDLLELFATPTLADWKKYLGLCVVYNIVHDQVHFSQTYLYPDMCVDCAHHKTVNSSNHLLNPMHSSTHLYHLHGMTSQLMSHSLLLILCPPLNIHFSLNHIQEYSYSFYV